MQASNSNSSKTLERYHHTYSHNQKVSKSQTFSKKHTVGLQSPDDQVEHKSVRFVSSESRKYLQPQQTSLQPSSLTHVRNTGSMLHPDTAPQLSSIPGRSSPSALRLNGGWTSMNTYSGDMQLTSYPRSHTHAMQLRGQTWMNGNGQVPSNYNATRVINNGAGRGYSTRHYGQNGHFKNSLSNNNLADVAKLGSLV